MTTKIYNGPNRYPSVPMYRTGETWLHRIGIRTGRALVYLLRVSDDSIHGPFSTLDESEEYIRRNGGGYLDWGTSSRIVPDRRPGQMALLHHSRGAGLGWRDWRHCEDHPHAFDECGRNHAPTRP